MRSSEDLSYRPQMEPDRLESLVSVKSLLENTEPTPQGIDKLVVSLGYRLTPGREQLLDSDALFQQKDLRQRIIRTRRIYAQSATWIHPISKQPFSREASIILVELLDEQTLRSRWPFEITRYAVKFGFQTTQALFFFTAPNSRSFVVTAYTEMLDAPSRVEVRRLVVDIDNITRTDVESISGLSYSRMRPDTIINEFRMALPYLKVGQSFFREYHSLFQLLTKRLRRTLKSEEETYGYAQRLLGRITFLYFLQRKGWLDGDRAYLKKWTKGLDGRKLFDLLYDLFDILNTETNQDKSKGNIPYLNGSLFEREPYSEAQIKKISEACGPLLQDILRVFDQYNFTISESTPLDKEVAVDPELLGSLFESMLPESERGDKGTFYTHQDEMLFMAREALRVYLTRFSDLLNRDQIFHIVYGLNLPRESRIEPKVAREVKDRLKEIKILDPAVGSGGFLMAALQALLEARSRLNIIIGTVETDYDAKLEIIEKNLFGVDIEREAIELARLRLWLTLVVDEFLENVRPLPNLDYNLHWGDSLKLLEFEKSRQSRIDIDQTVRNALLSQVARTREEYSRSHGKVKDAKRLQLENALRKLLELETGIKPAEVLPFSYRYFFADVMADGGFDVVLMNPPYIQQEDIGKLPGQNPKTYKVEIADDMKLVTDNKFSPNKQSDISVYFHIRSLSLLKEGGVAVVIATNKWLDTRYGVPLQEYFLLHSAIDCIYDSAYRSFSADVNTIITIIRKISQEASNNLVRFVYYRIPFRQVTGELIHEVLSYHNEGLLLKDSYRITARTQRHLYKDGLSQEDSDPALENSNATLIENKVNFSDESGRESTYVGSKWGNLHLRAPPVYYEILRRAGNRLKALGRLRKIVYGIKTGAIEFFILSRVDGTVPRPGLMRCKNGFGHELLLEKQFCRPILRDPEDISSYFLRSEEISFHLFMCGLHRHKLQGTYALKYIRWAETSPDAMVRVLRGKDRGKKVRIPDLATVGSREEWYQSPNLKPSKLLLPVIIKNRHVVPLCNEEIYGTNNYDIIYCDSPIDLWLYLNSSIFRLFMELNGRWEGAGALQIMVYEYKQCPVLDPLPTLSRKFRKLEQFKSRTAYRFVNITEQGPVEFDQDDRRELDDLVLQELGFEDQEERRKVLSDLYEWLQSRVRERLTKPKTAPESIAKSVGKRLKEADLREFQ